MSEKYNPRDVKVSFFGQEIDPCSFIRVVGRVVVTGTTTVPMVGVGGAPACHPSMPCGCYGCPTCNGAQAPIYGYAATTPALGVPVLEDCTFEPTAPTYACNRYNPCGHHDCQKCFPGQILPPDMRGSKKPNGGGSQATKAANRERGYRVLPYADWLNAEQGTREGETFSTPDLATQRARRGAKEGKETFLVLRDGARWKLLKADGDEVVIG